MTCVVESYRENGDVIVVLDAGGDLTLQVGQLLARWAPLDVAS